MSTAIAKILFKISATSRKLGKNLVKKDRDWYQQLHEWNRADGEHQFRTNYDLDADSVVFDLGGYEGQWASDIFAKYLCAVHVFEPHPVFVKNISKRFAKNDKLKIYPFGLGAKDEAISLGTDADATSMFKTGKDSVAGHIQAASSFLHKHQVDRIDLMKINIEGGEYDLLEHLIASGKISLIKNIQVQFHHFIPQAEERMARIQEKLKETHALTYQFKFLWENWQLK